MKIKNFKSFDEVLRAFLDERDQSNHQNDYWWASELGSCKRKQFFRRLELIPTETKEYRIQFLGGDGSACHGWREEAAKKMGAVIESEGKIVDDDLKWRGRFDLLLVLNNKPVILDIKSQRSEAFFYRNKRSPAKKIDGAQKLQLASYIYFFNKHHSKTLEEFGFPKGTLVKEGRIYFVDRGSGERDEYVFKFKKKMFDKVVNELESLNQHWESKTIPQIEKSWLCRYCPYKSICKKVDGQEKLSINQLLKIYGQNKRKTKSNK